MQAWHNRLPGPGFAAWPRVPRVLAGYPRVSTGGRIGAAGLEPGSDFRNYYVILRVHYGTTGPCDRGLRLYARLHYIKYVDTILYMCILLTDISGIYIEYNHTIIIEAYNHIDVRFVLIDHFRPYVPQLQPYNLA